MDNAGQLAETQQVQAAMLRSQLHVLLAQIGSLFPLRPQLEHSSAFTASSSDILFGSNRIRSLFAAIFGRELRFQVEFDFELEFELEFLSELELEQVAQTRAERSIPQSSRFLP